jgi:hypothetical protein
VYLHLFLVNIDSGLQDCIKIEPAEILRTIGFVVNKPRFATRFTTNKKTSRSDKNKQLYALSKDNLEKNKANSDIVLLSLVLLLAANGKHA